MPVDDRAWGAYADRRVLILGGTGFIGVNLARRLVQAGADVTVTSSTDRGLRERIQGVRSVTWEVRDRDGLRRLVAATDVIFSLVGHSGAVRSIREPWADLEVNCEGQLTLLEAMRTERVEAKVVFPGSRLQFGRVTELPVTESHPMEPLDLYGTHKLTGEKYHVLYHRVHGLRTTVLRITNPYGPGQPADRTDYGFVNWLIQRALGGEPLTIFGDGRQLRDLLYVDDLTDALLAAGASPATDGDVYNIGSGVGVSIAEVAETIVKIVGGGRIEHVPWPPLALAVETGDFVADISKFRKAVGWRPQIELREGLERTVAAYRKAASGRRRA